MVGMGCPQFRKLLLRRDEQCGGQAGQDPLALERREPGIQGDGYDARREQPDDHVEVLQRRRHEQRDPVSFA